MKPGIAIHLAGIAGLVLALPIAAATQAVCDRTPEVRDKLVDLAGVSACEDVTTAHLAQVTSLDFEAMGISELKAHDFSGLSSLESLDLSQNRLSSLPEGVFDGLSGLKLLHLGYNDLSNLGAEVFDGLGDLQQLLLGGNDLTGLPEEIFDGLGNLQRLGLWSNDLASLPKGIFEGLGSLKYLRLRSYKILEDLPAGTFEGLDSLQFLYLERVSLGGLPAGIFDDVLDTLGGAFTVDGRDYRGALSLNLEEPMKSELSFASTSQTVPEGETVRVEATLSTALPVAIRLPYIVGGTATSGAYADLSPSPSDGLLFLAGETRKEITLTLNQNSGNRGETIVLTLAERAEIGLRRSDGTGPDAPHLVERTGFE